MEPQYKTITEKLEAIRRLTPKGGEYWFARELMPVLGYDTWRNFEGAIEQAKIAFDAAGEDASHHFADTSKKVMIGSGAERSIDDYFLSRAACYIICMNGDSSKPEIAEGQKYYAVQTRKMEKLERCIAGSATSGPAQSHQRQSATNLSSPGPEMDSRSPFQQLLHDLLLRVF